MKADRKAFCRQLERVCVIRNQVMHFDPDGLADKNLRVLPEFSSFLKRLDQIRSRAGRIGGSGPEAELGGPGPSGPWG